MNPTQHRVDNDIEVATNMTTRNSEADATATTEPIPVAANVILLDDVHDHHDNDEYSSSRQQQPPLHAHMDDDNIPTVQAVFQEEEEEKPDAIRLDSTHIVSVRSADLRAQPEFASIILVNRPAYADFEHSSSKGILGITLQAKPDGKLVISRIDPSSPFAETCMQSGHILMSIDQTTCRDMDPDSALAALLSAVTTTTTSNTTRNNHVTTIRLHCPDGTPALVATTAEKATPSAKLGVTFGSNARGSVILTNVSATGVMANSLLNDRDRVLLVNGQDCSNIALAATQVARWVQQAPRFVTIVSETTTSTGVVIATGEQSVRSNIHTAGLVVVPSTSTNSNATREQNQQRPKTVCWVFVFVLFMVFIGVIVSASSADEQDDNYYYDGGNYWDNYYTPSPTPAPTANRGCLHAMELPMDGTVVRGKTQYSQFAPNQGCSFCYDQQNTGRGSWFTFTAQDFEYLEVVTCSDSLLGTVMTLYESHSGSCDNLSSVGSSDLEGFGLCNDASSFEFHAYPGSTYYVLVQGPYYQTDTFRIRLVNATDYNYSQCRCGVQDDFKYSPSFAPTGVQDDSPSPSKFVGTSTPTTLALTSAPTSV